MKIIGKQIVVELPERKDSVLAILDKSGKRYYEQKKLADGSWNEALSEVARMNQAWEVDEGVIKSICLDELLHEDLYNDLDLKICDKYEKSLKATALLIAQTLASNPSKFIKEKSI